MKELFPEPEYEPPPAAPRTTPSGGPKHLLTPDVHPLWGIEHGCRTVVIYSPEDLSCYWNQVGEPARPNPSVIKALRVGQNVVDYATGRELPADKLAVREVTRLRDRDAQARRPAHRQAPARRRLERRPAGDPQPDDHAPRQAQASTW